MQRLDGDMSNILINNETDTSVSTAIQTEFNLYFFFWSFLCVL